MYNLGLAFIILAPISSAMFLIGSTSLYWAWIPAAMLAVGVVFNLLSGNWRMRLTEYRWLWPFAAFLVVAGVSLILSPYRGQALVKGGVQIAGMCMMLLTVIAFLALVRERKAFVLEILRWTSVVLGVVGAIALFQFGVNNLLRMELVSFKFLQIFGGGTGWRPPGMLGALFRANSIEGEPAHMATFLCMGAGLAFIRLGGLGERLRQSPTVQQVMPFWAALCIVGGFATSLSIIGYLGLIVAVAGTAFVWFRARRRKETKRRRLGRRAVFAAAACLAVGGLIYMFAGQNIVEKLATLGVLYDNPGDFEETGLAGTADLVSQGGNRLSALALAVNGQIMLDNLRSHPVIGVGIGAHPASYDQNVPEYVDLVPALMDMNKDDAGALMTRLLSETGILGTLIFLAGGFWIFWTGICATRLCALLPGSESLAPVLAGVTGSWLAVFILYLARLGLYYSPAFWASLSFIVVLTDVAVTAVRKSPDLKSLPRGFWRRTILSGA
jgi:hypothetical protein